MPFHSDLELVCSDIIYLIRMILTNGIILIKVNATASNRFIVESKQDVSTGGCVLCFNQVTSIVHFYHNII